MVSTHLKNMNVKLDQIGSFPQVGVKIKNIWNHHLDNVVDQNILNYNIETAWTWPQKTSKFGYPVTQTANKNSKLWVFQTSIRFKVDIIWIAQPPCPN